MPPVDNYISIFYWKTMTGPRYYNGRGIRPNVEMNCNDIFMRHIFWSTWNVKVIAQSPAITAPQPAANGKTCLIVGGRCWEKIVFHGHSIDCSYVCTSKQVGLEVNTIIEDVRGWRNSKRIELLRSDDPTPSSQIGWVAPRECNTRMRDPKCSR